MDKKSIHFSQIVFEAVRGNGYQGDIAIDDVSVTATCPAPCKYLDNYFSGHHFEKVVDFIQRKLPLDLSL